MKVLVEEKDLRHIFVCHQIVQNEKGNGDGYIRHGNLDSTRTYNHIDDGVKA